MEALDLRRDFIETIPDDADRAEIAAMPGDMRQQRFADMLVRHPAFDGMVDFLEFVHMPFPGGSPNRGRITAMYFPYRGGKSTAARFYMRRFPEYVSETVTIRPMVFYRAQGRMTPAALLKGLYRAVTGLVPPAKNEELLLSKIVERISRHQVQMLFLDDLQGAMAPRSVDRVNGILTEILEAKVCHVTVAGPEELDGSLRVDAQLWGRGGLLNEKFRRLDWHDPKDQLVYRKMLNDMDRMTPMRHVAGLGSKKLAAHFFDLYQDKFGHIHDLVFYAMAVAVRAKSEIITPHHLSMAAAKLNAPLDGFTHFIDPIPEDLVGKRAEIAEREAKGHGK